MGYTHYWRMSASFTDEEWSAITADARKLIERTDVPLCGDVAYPDKPVIDGDYIRFNGAGAAAYETFLLSREAQRFVFCKTSRLPYDTVVTAVLACAAEHAPNTIAVSSDGNESSWHDGLTFASHVLERPIAYPVK